MAETSTGSADTIEALTLVPKAEARQSMKDFKSDQGLRWCPGCGDYAVLAAVQGFMPESAWPRRTSSSCRASGARPASRTT